MVGHDVGDLADPQGLELVGQPGIAVFTAQPLVEPGVIDDVVSRPSGPGRLQERGAVQVADAEFGQVVGRPRGVIKGKARAELDAIGRGRPDTQLLWLVSHLADTSAGSRATLTTLDKTCLR